MRIAHTGALVLVLAVGAACDETTSAPMASEELFALSRAASLSDSQAARRLRQAFASRNRSELVAALSSIPPAEVALTADEAANLDPDDPSTWPPAHIESWEVRVAIGRPEMSYENYAYGQMNHNGQVGNIILTVRMQDSTGHVIQSYGPTPRTEINAFGPLRYDRMMHSVNLMPPTACGHSVEAMGVFEAWNVGLLPPRWDPLNLPARKSGYSAKGASASAEQPPCRGEGDGLPEDGSYDEGPDDGSGGGTGGGSYAGGSYVTEACLYYDWYHGDGTYWFTETVYCWVIGTTVNDT